MKQTEKLKLNKPELTDYVNIEDLNDNMDILDEAVGELQEGSTVIEELETENKTLAGAINELDNKKAENDDLLKLEHSELSSVATNADDEGIYKNVEWERTDGTLYAKSGLVGEYPYEQIKVDYYDEAGEEIVKTITWDLTYDDDDFPYKKEVI